MATIEAAKIQRELTKIKHPELKKDIVSLGMIGSLDIQEGETNILLKTPNQDRRVQIGLEAQIRQILTKLEGIGKVKIKFEVDPKLVLDDSNKIPGVLNVIAIGSGKGGVGKSTVTVNLAAIAVSLGYKVGILDADIYGPSIGKMFGVNGRVALKAEEDKIYPLIKDGIKLISFSFLIDEKQPVIWRGPMLGKAVEQFLYDIVWDELDYLFIDLPPGTGDVQLSLAQLIDLDGALIVTTPQSVALLDATRASAMFSQVKVPVLGVVENMSEFICPKCGHVSAIFSKGGGRKLADSSETSFLGGIPLTMDIMNAGENGSTVVLKDKKSPVYQAYKTIFDNLNEEIKKWE
ncbi:Mrp/NBP35 family ATP-binding protein [Leptospira borgpetersenii]|uniref:Iron-sulfur cluster carrier protein n=2 Tax=Leptospira borgpetersenii serovar Hardjo-bovis TaxID=338217 RepID=Q04T96_LEPBJ|nr:Mrp/NBP35 family ATP-binding protein [Leptospira borgpetersenii]ABJ75874.1 ATPase involved in chromosome partitioning [Leptospira borgpetersenii serovar Hardjo-bovis str. JB197]ABJ78977.1 ATPase involved in chromosome partitioning [Leptospira borgpetersenii serovar Hardjo-bovis str. L550]AMX58272.1 chromosome partitioning protein [Leptospira borgpetersenii serovar Hardjo]AMX61525.1 chromosome partitioning protein [Leptospira borgpetersenii serovar Hardjo]AMX64769.1 chromosome partitioning p